MTAAAVQIVQARKRGRPTAFQPEFVELARNYCLLGATNAALARNFGVELVTLERWMRQKPDFRGAIKEGREEADAKMAKSLFHRGTGYERTSHKVFMVDTKTTKTAANGEKSVTVSKREKRVPVTEHYPPDTAAAFIWLKNRRPDLWRDRKELEHTGPNGGPLQVQGAVVMVSPQDLSVENRERLRAVLLAAKATTRDGE